MSPSPLFGTLSLDPPLAMEHTVYLYIRRTRLRREASLQIVKLRESPSRGRHQNTNAGYIRSASAVRLHLPRHQTRRHASCQPSCILSLSSHFHSRPCPIGLDCAVLIGWHASFGARPFAFNISNIVNCTQCSLAMYPLRHVWAS